MAVTEDDVVWCYNSILGRKPESAEAIQRQIASANDFRTLVLRFMASEEYQRRISPSDPRVDGRAMDVDTRASAADLSLLKDRIREAWTHLGLVRPHHSVLTGKEFLPEAINEESIERFYASGAKEAKAMEATLKRYGFSQLQSKICVEYGCGLGRVTLALASMFKKVHGYDISANHLALAGKRAADSEIHNVAFHQCSAELISEPLEKCDFFYSRIVFQHNPPPLIRELITASLKSLREGGIAVFQVPTYGADYSFRIKEYLMAPLRLDMEMHCIPQQEVFSLVSEARCRVLEVMEDGSVGRRGQWISNMFIVQKLER